MSGLPRGWCPASLAELCTRIVDGSHNPPKAAQSGRPMLSARNIQARRIVFDDFRWISESDFNSEHARTQIAPGDVLLTIVGTIGRTAVVPADAPKFTLQRSVAVLKAQLAAEPRYLAYVIESPDVQRYFEENAKGTAQKGIYLAALGEVEVSLAPLPEQKRIADKLDTLLARVDACRDRLDRVPGILRRFRQSVLAAATSGELTREWREERGLDVDRWARSTVGQLIEGIEAGLNVQCEERPPAEGERGLVKISAVTWGTYDDNESKTLPRGVEVPERSRIRTGDFLISRANTLELVGACVIVHRVTRPVFLSDKILRLVMPEEWKPWLLLVLQSPEGRREIEARASGNQLSMRNLSQANLREIPVQIPSPDERAEIVRRVESLLAVAGELERRCQVQRAMVEKLTPSVLAKAFRGELVAQNPDDEPASRLLARLGARSDSASSRKPKRNRTRSPRTEAEPDAPQPSPRTTS